MKVTHWVFLVSLACMAFSADAQPFAALDYWQWRSPLPQGNDLQVVSLLNNRFVAGGEYGSMISSADGTNWVFIEGQGHSENAYVKGLAFGNDVYVATMYIPDGGKILVSSNGIQWTTLPNGFPYFSSVAFGNGVFVATAFIGGWYDAYAFRSSNGVNWIASPLPHYTDKVLFRDGTFWAAGDGFSSSSNGVDWIQHFHMTDNKLFRDVTFGAGKWLGIRSSPPGYYDVASSPDGTNWTTLFTEPSGVDYYASLEAVAYGAGRFVVMGQRQYFDGSYSPILWTSPDAVTWTPGAISYPERPLDVLWAGDRFIAVGAYGAIAASADGQNWAPLNNATSTNFRNVSFVNNRFIAVGNSGLIFRSDDGVSWAQASNPGTDKNVRDVIFQDGLYVGLAGKGKILTSYDADSWAVHSSPATIDLFGLTYGQGQFVAVGGDYQSGYDFVIMSSTNGTNWVVRSQTAQYQLHDVAYGNGAFVAVGGPGTVVTSTNGLDWGRQQVDPSMYLKSVAYGNGRFVVVGESSNAFVSLNATNWARYPVNSTPWLQIDSITFGDGVFVAVGENGRIYVSADGATWAAKQYISANSLRGVAYGKGSFVAVGNNNTILQTLPRPQLRITRSGSSYDLQVTADSMRTYRLQSSLDFSPGGWSDAASFYQTSWNTNMLLQPAPGAQMQFYRIVFP